MSLINDMVRQGNFLFRYRSFLPLVLMPLAFAIIYFKIRNGSYMFTPESMNLFDWVALGTCLLGLLIRIKTVGHTPANTSGRNTKEGQVADTVNSTGMYSIVRHPLYLGNYFMWLGIALFTQSIWFSVAFTLVYWLYYERIMMAEEHFLTGKFGDLYTSWAESVPAFVPRMSGWKSPSLPFSIRKVLKKEKNGLFAIFLVLWVLQFCAQYWQTGAINYATKPVLFIGTLVTGVIYLILKVIKRSTKVLDEVGR